MLAAVRAIPETNDTPEKDIVAILSLISFSPHGLSLFSLFLQSIRLFADMPIKIISNAPATAPAAPFASVLPNFTPANSIANFVCLPKVPGIIFPTMFPVDATTFGVILTIAFPIG
ncbi:gp2 [Wolbachia sp. wKue]|nr:gp2 [Wolbachia phage WO]